MEPNPNDPLNREAATIMRDNEYDFKQRVSKTLKGGTFEGINYPKFL